MGESKRIFISVIIPTYDAEKTIINTLNSFISQTFDKDKFEILIVDDGSTDNTKKLVNEFINKYGNLLSIKFIEISHKGAAAARNVGIKNSLGDIIVFIDSDCIAPTNWLEEIARTLSRSEEKCAGICSIYEPINNKSLISRFIQYDHEFRVFKVISINNSTDFVGSYGVAFKKSALLNAGLFNEKFTSADGEDADLSYRITSLGYKLKYNPYLRILHNHPSTVKKFLKQQISRGKWRIFLFRKYPRKFGMDKYSGLNQIVQPLLQGILLILAATILYFGLLNTLILSLVLIYVIPVLLNIRFLNYTRSKGEKLTNILAYSLLLCIRGLCWIIGACLGLGRLFSRGKS